MRNALRDQLLKKQQQLKQELKELEKKNKENHRRATVVAQKSIGVYDCQEVVMPQYVRNDEQKIYEEVN